MVTLAAWRISEWGTGGWSDSAVFIVFVAIDLQLTDSSRLSGAWRKSLDVFVESSRFFSTLR
jgi:hypothetical protein